MVFNRERFKSLVHYVCWKAGDPAKLGATKLNKVCWLADFTAFYEMGRPITDARYVKRQYGPVPSAAPTALRELEQERRLLVKEVPFHGLPKKEFIPLSEPDMDGFSDRELEIIDWATRYVCDEHTASSISEVSHDHIWKAAADGEEIPFFTIFAVPAPITETELEWAAEEIEGLR